MNGNPQRVLRVFASAMLVTTAACEQMSGRGSVAGSMVTPAQPKSDLRFVDTSNDAFDFKARTKGKLTLVFFGYTHCPDVCPVTMANIGAAVDRLDAQDRAKLAVVFITTDPARDSTAHLRRWLNSFGHDFIGLRGDSAAVADAERAFGIPPSITEQHSGSHTGSSHEDYRVGHSAVVLVFTPDDSLRVQYPFGTRQADWARDIPKLLQYKSVAP